MLTERGMLFSQVAFHIVISQNLSKEEAEELSSSLTRFGAEEIVEPSEDGAFDLHGITHIISATIDFENYDKATELMISVVKPSWIQSSLTKLKMANPRSHSPDPNLCFSGLMVFIADLPENDKSAIIGGLEALGGIYAGAISRQVTHIVALTLNSDACQIAISKKLNIKIVLPHWFDDCLRLGRRINEEPYLLPDPDILEPSDGTHPRPKQDKRLIGVSLSVNKDALTPPSSPATRSVFKNHKLLLSDDLGISEHLQATLKAIIESGGGEVVERVDQADILVCQYREGQDFKDAGATKLTIGNLPWLFHIVSTNSWTSPMRRLLHFPVSKTGLPGFRSYRISLSNYNGDARLYLENLAKAAGCEFTKSMKQDNTHLITAHTLSEKCDAAKEWNIHMINHLWLEDSYAKWAIQSVANPRYTHFPARTNLSEVVGQTEIDRDALQAHFFPAIETPVSPKLKSTPASKVEKKTKPEKPEAAEAITEPAQSSPALSHRTKGLNATPATTRKNRKSALVQGLETPASHGVGKENETPSTGGRSAKAKAMSNMAGYAEDFAKLAKEKKQKGGIVYGGRSSEDRVTTTASKRSMSLEAEADEEERAPKKSKKATVEPKMKLLVTGYSDWSQDQTTFKKDTERLAQLGIEIIDDPIGCTYLAAPKILRTKKFICAMAGAPTIMSMDFVLECLKQNKLLEPEDFPLLDKAGEKQYHAKLVDTVKRAKVNQGQMMRGWSIYITQDVRGGPETYEDIISSNGGKCVLFKGRATSLEATDKDGEESSNTDGFVYLVTSSTKSDQNLWPRFREQAEAAGHKPRIVKTDWVLDNALAQQMRWDRTYTARPEDS